jgi:hypothetical protein
MQTVKIELTVPDGTNVVITGLPVETQNSSGSAETAAFKEYWNRLSKNGQMVFRAAAELEENSGVGYSLEDIADHLGAAYESVRSMHRTSGRSARKWRKDTGTDEPIKLECLDYKWDGSRGGMRSTYELSAGAAHAIKKL